MRVAWIILAVIALVGVVWLAIGGEAWQAPPTMGGPAEGPAASSPDPLVADRVPVPEREDERGRETTPALDEPVSPTDPDPPEPDMGRVELVVLDEAANRLVFPFRGTFWTPALSRSVTGTAPGTFLDLPLEVVGNLLIEADGYTPDSREGFSVPSETPELQLGVHLRPAAPFSGIDIRAVDDRGAPVPHLQVSVWNDPDSTRPLWVRRRTEESGIYQLPDLQPADYRLQLAAVDERGALRPLLTHTETVTFGGGERVLVPVQFLPGALFTITVLDVATGKPRGTEVSVRLTSPDGQARSTLWRSQLQGEVLERRDGLPAAAPASLAEPLPPGSYQLLLELSDGAQHTQEVFLPAGQHETLTIRM